MSETEKITVVEGPTPAFEPNTEPWLLALSEGPAIPFTGRCLLRTFDGDELLQRCRKAWQQGRAVCLEFTNMDGLPEEALILAARVGEVEAGEVLHLWLRLNSWPEGYDDPDDPLDFESDDEDAAGF